MEVVLTEEGREYLAGGFPEINLIRLLKERKGCAEISEIEMPYKNIAILWAKRNGWIRIEGGKVFLTDLGYEQVEKETYELYEALKEVAGSGACSDERLLSILFSRKLVKKVKDIKVPEEIAQLTEELIISGKWREAKGFKKYDIHVPVPELIYGKKHPYVQFIEEVREKLVEMGFEEVKSPIVELEFWNCDTLFMPQDHPARSLHDIFYIAHPDKGEVKDKNLLERVVLTHKNGWLTGSKGWGYFSIEKTLNLVLRSHTTPSSIRYLASMEEEREAKVFCIDRVFRPDVIDRTHLMEFDQCEGIICGKSVTFRHLLGILKEFAREVLGCEKVRFVPHYFPYTEPSVEMYVYHEKLRKWIEVVGAGMFRPEVLKPLGIEKSKVLAWGFGFSRLAMLKLEIDDIRYLFAKDIEWLRKFPRYKSNI